MTIALSTLYAQQERFESGEAFARFAREAGYDAIEVSHSTPEAKLRAILESDLLPVVAIHQPAPHVPVADGRGNADLNLAATDRAERAEALAHALASIEWAASAGATSLVVHLGEVEAFWPEGEAELYRLHAAGGIASVPADAVRAEMVARRANAAPAALEAARASLEQLIDAAKPHGIVIGLENRLHFHEIPHPGEGSALLDGLPPPPWATGMTPATAKCSTGSACCRTATGSRRSATASSGRMCTTCGACATTARPAPSSSTGR